MARSVVFPDPEGPMMASHSPFCTLRWTSESACVSTSSVRNTFWMPCISSSVCCGGGTSLGFKSFWGMVSI